MSQKVNILVLDNNEIAIEAVVEFYQHIFEELGYECEFIPVESPKGIITEAPKNKSIFDKNIIDIFICDLSLGGDIEGNFFGLHVIKEVKREYPEMLVIANSYNAISTTKMYEYGNSIDLFVEKVKFLDTNYQETISQDIEKIFNRNILLEVDFENSEFHSNFKIQSIQQKNKVINLLKKITFTTIGLSGKTSVNSVILKKIESGESNSFVFNMTSRYQNGIECIPTIIKISDKQQARVERDNYINNVKWNLPYNWRVELINYSEWQDLGCLCYSYAVGSGQINSVTEFIKNNKFEKVNKVISTIFDPTTLSWFHDSNIEVQESITSYYLKKWFKSSNNRTRKVPKESIDYLANNNGLKFDDNYITVYSTKIQRPSIFLNRNRGRFYTCICHGDLNSNNILFSDTSKNPVFIDFQDTGRGHIFEDFVVFEGSIKFYGDFELGFKDIYETEISISKYLLNEISKSDILNIDRPQFDSILKVREAALKTFPKGCYTGYLYSLAMSCWARLRKAEKLEKNVQNQLFASLLASINILQDYGITKISEEVSIEKPAEIHSDALISFNSLDRDFIIKILSDLKKGKVSTWYDEEQLKGGDKIVTKISKAIEAHNKFVIAFNEDGSGNWQQHEIDQIVAKQIEIPSIKIVPLILEGSTKEAIPKYLQTFKFIDFNQGYNESLTKLINTLTDK